jgi:regulatory LuxR family protein
MSLPQQAETARKDIVRLAHAGLDSADLRRAIAARLRRVVPAEAYGFATVDPATMLLTGSVRENIPDTTVALLAANEYGEDDYIKFSELARRAVPVGRLAAATRGDLARSRRYRDVFIPQGWRDEMRAVFSTGDAGWGFICLHRERSSPDFIAAEARFLASLTGHVAAGLRKAVLIGPAAPGGAGPGPGIIEVTDELELIRSNQAAGHWLTDAGGTEPLAADRLPHAVHAVVAQLRALEAHPLADAPAPRLRMRGRSGRWLTIHASRLHDHGHSAGIAVIIEPAPPADVAVLIGQGYGLSRRETEVCALTARGLSTPDMARHLSISANTV